MMGFRTIFEILLELRRYIRLILFKCKWRKENPHNFTTPKNIFDINKVKVGINTYGALFVHSFGGEGKLEIGSYCSIAENVHFFLAGGHDYKRFTTYPIAAQFSPKVADELSKGKIVIEDDVWIGFGCTILSGVIIGKGAVIAAGSVVAKDVPPYSVFIDGDVNKFRFDDEICSKLCTLDFNQIDGSKIRNDELIFEHITKENVDDIVKRIEAYYINN